MPALLAVAELLADLTDEQAANVLAALRAYEAGNLDELANANLTPEEAAVFGEILLENAAAVEGHRLPKDAPVRKILRYRVLYPRPLRGRTPAPRRPSCASRPRARARRSPRVARGPPDDDDPSEPDPPPAGPNIAGVAS